jgi:hypothetical protein
MNDNIYSPLGAQIIDHEQYGASVRIPDPLRDAQIISSEDCAATVQINPSLNAALRDGVLDGRGSRAQK